MSTSYSRGSSKTTHSSSTVSSPPLSSEDMLKEMEFIKSYITGDSLNASGEPLEKSSLKALASLIQSPDFEHLTTLDLSRTDMDDSDFAVIAEALENNRNIISVNLADNLLSDGSARKLFIILDRKSNSRISSLSLEDNPHISPHGVGQICEMLLATQTLQRLDLSGIEIGSKLPDLLHGIKSNKTLKSLILENSKLDGNLLSKFINGLCEKDNRSMLEELSLSFNQASGCIVYQSLFENPKFSSLRKLHLCYINNQQDVRGRHKPVKLFHRFMTGNRTITHLSLQGNNFQNTDCDLLKSIIATTTTLKYFDLGDNNIEYIGALALYHGAKVSSSLEFLALDNNRFLQHSKGQLLYQNIITMLQEKKVANKSSCVQARSILGGPTNQVRSKQKRSSIKRDNRTKSDDGNPGVNQAGVTKSIAKKKSKKRVFAAKIGAGKCSFEKSSRTNLLVAPSLAPPTLTLDTDDDTLVIESPAEDTKIGKGIDEELESIEFTTKRRKFPKGVKPRFAENPDIVNNASNNLDNEEDTCVILDPCTGVYSDEDDASVVFDDRNEDNYDSVIFEEENAGKTVHSFIQEETKLSDKVFKKKDSVSDFGDRLSNKTAESWSFVKMSKSELGFLEHVRNLNMKKRNGNDHPAILTLKPNSIEILSVMLKEFENLLDRDEHGQNISRKGKNKRNFANKFGVIGHLKNQKPGEVINYALATSIIDQTLISRRLVRNITLLGVFAKLRREIGSGVETEIGGMLPSKLLLTVTKDNKPDMVTIKKLETFASSLLLIKVVIWSIFKCLSISNPEVDPQGRHLLEEFGKAMIEKNQKKCNNSSAKSVSEKIQKHKATIGKFILSGAVFELIDILVMLRPMYAIAETLLVTVKAKNPQPRLQHYEAIYKQDDQRAQRRLDRRRGHVNNIKRADLLAKKLRNVKDNKKRENKNKSEMNNSPKTLDKLLGRVEKQKAQLLNKNKQKKNNSMGASTARKQRKLVISKEVLSYRENCPERVQNVLSDLATETKSLLTILSIDEFLPILLSLCDYDQVVKHYEQRAEELLHRMPDWVDNMSNEFEAEILNHVAPELTPQVSKDIRFKPKNGPAKRSDSSKLSCKTEKNGGELASVFAKIRKKKENPQPANKKNVKSLQLEDESFFHPILNQVFSWNSMTNTSVGKVREFVFSRMNDIKRADQENFINHLKILCAKGCDKTIAMEAHELHERFSSGM